MSAFPSPVRQLGEKKKDLISDLLLSLGSREVKKGALCVFPEPGLCHQSCQGE
jgi:hypothetical protein